MKPTENRLLVVGAPHSRPSYTGQSNALSFLGCGIERMIGARNPFLD